MLASESSGWAHWEYCVAPITSLVLAGEQERAAQYVQKLEREASHESSKREIRASWERVTADIPALCARMHAQEAENIKALKLEGIWEPSPFPVELPSAQRGDKSAESVFLTAPWVSGPRGLWQELPTEPGDVRFAKGFHRREGRLALPAALTREEAEVRHRAGETYVLAARLPAGLLLMIHLRGWDRNDPWTSNRVPTPRPISSFLIELHGKSRFARASTSFDRDGTGVVPISSIEIQERLQRNSVWSCSINGQEGIKRIWDSRSGKEVFSKSTLSPEERELATCPIPAFGEYAAIADRVCALLQTAGFGRFPATEAHYCPPQSRK